MFFTIGKPESINDLDIYGVKITELKNCEKILVIDDQPFNRQEALVSHGFRITKINDVKSLEQVEPYSIVACDIQGVGERFESEYQGAHVISEIRKAYPDKYLIAFTGALHNALYSEMLRAADLRTQKGIDLNSWIEYLEEALKNVGNPKQRWIRMRRFLVEEGYDTYYILKVEQAYIKSIISRDASHLESKRLLGELPEGLVALVVKFAATAVIELIKHMN